MVNFGAADITGITSEWEKDLARRAISKRGKS